MRKKTEPAFMGPLKAKDYYMREAWEYFKERENLYPWLTLEFFNLHWKDRALQERWGAFRHAYTSAAFTKRYNEPAAKAFGDANEIIQFGTIKSFPSLTKYEPGNTPQDRRMDLKNNAVGRKIASKNSGANLLDEVYDALDNDPDIILNQNVNNDTPYNDNYLMNKIWKAADKGYYEKKSAESSKELKNKILTGGASPINDISTDDYEDSIAEKPLSFKDRLLQSREEKLARYTQRLAESPQKTAERESKHVTLEELKAPQEARKKRVRDIINGTVEFDEEADLSGYENKKSKDNKIFTKEDIEEMSEEEKASNKEAIIYQEQTIGVPTRKQAEKATEKGGMVHVSSYTRSNGTKVRSYYRSR